MHDITTVQPPFGPCVSCGSRVTPSITTEEEFWSSVVIADGPQHDLWSGTQICVVLGFDQRRATQSGQHALDKVAVLYQADATRTLRTLLHRAQHPTPNMLNIVERRDDRLAAHFESWRRRRV